MSRKTFLIGGGISVVFTMIILLVAGLIAKNRAKKTLRKTVGIVFGLYGLLNLFYFMNWIPPVPMALRYSGIYHHLSRRGYQYELQYEKPDDWEFWRKSNKVYKWMPGDTVYCFAAIFAPTEINKTIHYQWELYDPLKKEWWMTDDQAYELQGGREGGYRGYSRKTVIAPGDWRIGITTEEGILLGSLDFKVVAVAGDYQRKLETIYR